MKKLAGLIILLAAVILGGYYGMGIITEKTIKKNITVLDQSNGLYVEIPQYDRGLFSSQAKFKWLLKIPAQVSKVNGQVIPAQEYTYETPLTIYHGPVIFAHNKVRFGFGYAETTLNLPKDLESKFNSTFSNQSEQPKSNLSIFINYLNESTVNFAVPTFKLFVKDNNGIFEWLGMDSKTVFSSGMKKVKGDAGLQGLTFTHDDKKLSMQKMDSDFNLHETLAGLYLGDANFDLSSISFTDKNKKIFDLSNLNFKSDSDIKEHVFNAHFTVNMKSLAMLDTQYGPATAEIALRGIDADALARINQQVSTIQNGTDAQKQQAVLSILPEIPKLLSHGPELEISKLDFQMPEGKVVGNLLIALPKEDNLNLMLIIQKLHGNGRFQGPASLIKSNVQKLLIQKMIQNPPLQQRLANELTAPNPGTPDKDKAAASQTLTTEQVASMQVEKHFNKMLESGFLIASGTDYSIEFKFDQGRLTVNGKPFDPSMIK